jgi:hypothetical protein
MSSGQTDVDILDESNQATIPASGTVTVSIPVPRDQNWTLKRYTVLTNQAASVTTMPIATMYRGSVADGNAFDSTYTGARDSGDTDMQFPGGDRIVCQWVGGVAGTIATLSINGTVERVS